MGLDMYLIGVNAPPDAENPEDSYNGEEYFIQGVDKSKYAELGYWRKHPDLHGFIVKNFAGTREDNGALIPLDAHQIHQILDVIENDALPSTSGFFFGRSAKPGDEDYEQQKDEDKSTFTHALEWLFAVDEKGRKRAIFYLPSW